MRAALKCGYRLIDTASIYKVRTAPKQQATAFHTCCQNESDIGVALAEHFAASRATESVFVTSKVSPYDMGYDKCLASVKVPLCSYRARHLQLIVHASDRSVSSASVCLASTLSCCTGPQLYALLLLTFCSVT